MKHEELAAKVLEEVRLKLGNNDATPEQVVRELLDSESLQYRFGVSYVARERFRRLWKLSIGFEPIMRLCERIGMDLDMDPMDVHRNGMKARRHRK